MSIANLFYEAGQKEVHMVFFAGIFLLLPLLVFLSGSFLIYNGFVLSKKEGKSKANYLSLGLGCVIFFRALKKPFNINALRGFYLSFVSKRGKRGAEFKILSCLTC